jgi:1,6-anhydro-N-acetylmuramate kinase
VARAPRAARRRAADLVAVHGQTVFHAPPVSWQLLSAAPIAHALRVPVVFDLRAADLACGGQGAPITPIADFVLFRDEEENRAVVNLGGFCNVTLLERGSSLELSRVRARDVCACNQVLDAVARACLGRAFDEGGSRAASGRVDAGSYASCSRSSRHSRARRSLGTGDELGALVARHARRGAPRTSRARPVLRSPRQSRVRSLVPTASCSPAAVSTTARWSRSCARARARLWRRPMPTRSPRRIARRRPWPSSGRWLRIACRSRCRR